jgi:hypothetical protein
MLCIAPFSQFNWWLPHLTDPRSAFSDTRKVFSAGVSHYGVADCELLAKETHKFESRYLDSLIG